MKTYIFPVYDKTERYVFLDEVIADDYNRALEEVYIAFSNSRFLIGVGKAVPFKKEKEEKDVCALLK